MTQRRDDNAHGRTPNGARGPSQNAGVGPDGPIPANLVDRFFDGELDEAARREFLRALPRDLETCEEVAKTRRMLDMLKAGGVGATAGAVGSGASATSGPLAAPDLTGRIIARIDRKRGFASRHVRQLARVARLSIAAGLVLVVGAIAAVERVAPDATRLAPAPAPLTSAFRQTEAEVSSNLGSLASTFENIQREVAPADPSRLERRRGFATIRESVEGDPSGVMVAASHAPDAPAAGRTIAVAFRMGGKGTSMVWTLDMAPRDTPLDAPAAPGAGRVCPAARFIDAEGRCSGVIVPLGIDRLGRDDLGGPFVLPGRNLVPTPRPAELLTSRNGSLP